MSASNKRLGQHFLQDNSVLRAIAEAIGQHPGETIIEIGPGHGELTAELLGARSKGRRDTHLIAIEKDERLVETLNKKLDGEPAAEIIHGDALRLLPSIIANRKLRTNNYAVVGNIPYYITGRLLRILGELRARPSRVVLTIQKEVAERICAKPPRMNKLAAIVQFWAEPHILRIVPRAAFKPEPDVDSAIITLHAREKAPGHIEIAQHAAIVRTLFAQPRKTVFNNLRDGFGKDVAEKALRGADVLPVLRPQDLSLTDIAHIVRELPAART